MSRSTCAGHNPLTERLPKLCRDEEDKKQREIVMAEVALKKREDQLRADHEKAVELHRTLEFKRAAAVAK